MSTASGLHHAAERLHRWSHLHRATQKRRKQGYIRHQLAREMDAIGAAILDVYRLPPPDSLTSERSAGA